MQLKKFFIFFILLIAFISVTVFSFGSDYLKKNFDVVFKVVRIILVILANLSLCFMVFGLAFGAKLVYFSIPAFIYLILSIFLGASFKDYKCWYPIVAALPSILGFLLWAFDAYKEGGAAYLLVAIFIIIIIIAFGMKIGNLDHSWKFMIFH